MCLALSAPKAERSGPFHAPPEPRRIIRAQVAAEALLESSVCRHLVVDCLVILKGFECQSLCFTRQFRVPLGRCPPRFAVAL